MFILLHSLTGNKPLPDPTRTPGFKGYKTKSKLQIWRICQNFKFFNFEKNKIKLEQLECLRSEDTPPPRDYPYYWPVRFESQVHTIHQFISDPKSKEGESRKNKKNLRKI